MPRRDSLDTDIDSTVNGRDCCGLRLVSNGMLIVLKQLVKRRVMCAYCVSSWDDVMMLRTRTKPNAKSKKQKAKRQIEPTSSEKCQNVIDDSYDLLKVIFGGAQ